MAKAKKAQRLGPSSVCVVSAVLLPADIIFLKHACSIIRQSSNPVCGSWNCQASSPWAKQHRAEPVPSWRNHIQGWMTVWEWCKHALEKGCLPSILPHLECSRDPDGWLLRIRRDAATRGDSERWEGEAERGACVSQSVWQTQIRCPETIGSIGFIDCCEKAAET